MSKQDLPYFVSYAHADAEAVSDLVQRLDLRLKLANEFRFVRWQDGDLLPGESWAEEIARALDQCRFGLLLVSYAFLGSDFITKDELPRFAGPSADRRAVPVGLQRVPFDGSIDSKGLGDLQVFRGSGGRFYSELTTDAERDEFTNVLFEQILRVARKYF